MTDIFAELSPPYSTIVADPPWPYEDSPTKWQRDAGKTRGLSYSTMSLTELGRLPVAQLGTADAHLFLWTTQRFLWDARGLADFWGFNTIHVCVWCKEVALHCTGGAFPPNVEFLLVCRRRWGSVIRNAREALGISTVEMERMVRGGHSTGLGARWEESSSFPRPEHWTGLRAALCVDFAVGGDLKRATSSWWKWPRGSHSTKPAGFMDVVDAIAPEPRIELFSREPRLGWDSWGHGYELGVS